MGSASTIPFHSTPWRKRWWSPVTWCPGRTGSPAYWRSGWRASRRFPAWSPERSESRTRALHQSCRHRGPNRPDNCGCSVSGTRGNQPAPASNSWPAPRARWPGCPRNSRSGGFGCCRCQACEELHQRGGAKPGTGLKARIGLDALGELLCGLPERRWVSELGPGRASHGDGLEALGAHHGAHAGTAGGPAAFVDDGGIADQLLSSLANACHPQFAIAAICSRAAVVSQVSRPHSDRPSRSST